MRVIRHAPAAPPARRSAVTIGNFDGLHLGHQALVRRCVTLAGDALDAAVVTFHPLPQAWFRPQAAPARLMGNRHKLERLRALGVDLVWLMRFNRSLASLGAREFAEQVLAEGLAARHVVIGEDFRFGRGREGDVAVLTEFGRDLGFEVEVLPPVQVDGARVSSTRVREALGAGDLALAERLLGRPYRLRGRVQRGRGLGKDFGFPTANLHRVPQPPALQGIFAVRARLAGDETGWRAGVASLGSRPSVGGGEVLLEVHLFDFGGDLYGRRMEVEFVAKLRDEEYFEDLDDMVRQMHEDARQAREALAARPTATES